MHTIGFEIGKTRLLKAARLLDGMALRAIDQADRLTAIKFGVILTHHATEEQLDALHYDAMHLPGKLFAVVGPGDEPLLAKLGPRAKMFDLVVIVGDEPDELIKAAVLAKIPYILAKDVIAITPTKANELAANATDAVVIVPSSLDENGQFDAGQAVEFYAAVNLAAIEQRDRAKADFRAATAPRYWDKAATATVPAPAQPSPELPAAASPPSPPTNHQEPGPVPTENGPAVPVVAEAATDEPVGAGVDDHE